MMTNGIFIFAESPETALGWTNDPTGPPTFRISRGEI